MPTENKSEEQSFNSIITNEERAAEVLSESIEKQNQIFIDFCKEIIGLALIAAEKSDSKNESKGNAKAKAKTKEDLLSKASSLTTEIQAASDEKSPVNANGESSDPMATSFVQTMNDAMKNFVYAQRQLYVTAQATTTIAVTHVLSQDN